MPEIFPQLSLSFVPGSGIHSGNRRSPSPNPVQGSRWWHPCPLLFCWPNMDPGILGHCASMSLPESRTGVPGIDHVHSFCTSHHAHGPWYPRPLCFDEFTRKQDRRAKHWPRPWPLHISPGTSAPDPSLSFGMYRKICGKVMDYVSLFSFISVSLKSLFSLTDSLVPNWWTLRGSHL